MNYQISENKEKRMEGNFLNKYRYLIVFVAFLISGILSTIVWGIPIYYGVTYVQSLGYGIVAQILSGIGIFILMSALAIGLMLYSVFKTAIDAPENSGYMEGIWLIY